METQNQRMALSVCFVTSAYNEGRNIRELYDRCDNAVKDLTISRSLLESTVFRLVVADNCSQDNTREVIRELSKEGSNIVGIFNKKNYGPEASLVNALRISLEDPSSYTIILCSDLQDPPEICSGMVQLLNESEQLDSVLCIKTNQWEGLPMKSGRRLYYRLLRYSSRLAVVPTGYHGFGCYRQEVIRQAVELWDKTDLNLRQCLVNACNNPRLLEYNQGKRERGRSSYGTLGYVQEAARALLSSDASTSRLAFCIGFLGVALSLIAGIFIIINTLGGSSAYAGGTPTIMCLLISSFSIQMLMNALLSRQIEGIRTSFKPIVRFSIVDCRKSVE